MRPSKFQQQQQQQIELPSIMLYLNFLSCLLPLFFSLTHSLTLHDNLLQFRRKQSRIVCIERKKIKAEEFCEKTLTIRQTFA